MPNNLNHFAKNNPIILTLNPFFQKNKIEFARKFIHMTSILIPLCYLYVYKYLIPAGTEYEISFSVLTLDKHFGLNYQEFSILCLLWALIVSVVVELLRLENRNFRKLFNLTFGIMLRKHEKRDFTGASYLLTSAIVCIAFFPIGIACTALAFLSVGDTFAALVGINFGKRKLANSKKSFEGLLACFISTLSFGLLASHFLFRFFPADPAIILKPQVIFFGAIAACLSEVVNIPIDDNVKIPVCASIVMWVTNLIIS